MVAEGHIGETGVDEQVAAVLHHPGGRLGVMKAAIRTGLSCSARISGTDGWIEVPPFMHAPDHLVVGAAGATERIDAPWEGEGLRFQAVEVHRCLREGLTESPVMPLDETLALAGHARRDPRPDRAGLPAVGDHVVVGHRVVPLDQEPLVLGVEDGPLDVVAREADDRARRESHSVTIRNSERSSMSRTSTCTDRLPGVSRYSAMPVPSR